MYKNRLGNNVLIDIYLAAHDHKTTTKTVAGERKIDKKNKMGRQLGNMNQTKMQTPK